MFRHVEMIFQADTDLPGITIIGLVGEAHPGFQRRPVATYQIGRFVHFQPDAVTGAVWKAGQAVVRPEALLPHEARATASTLSQGAPGFAASKAAACARFSRPHLAHVFRGSPKT